jgi:uncharacterized protein (TIGR03084 family)
MNVNATAFRAECHELDLFLSGLKAEQWNQTTAFYGWTVADEIMHLHQVDGFAEIALTQADQFPALLKWVRDGQANGIELSQRMRDQWGGCTPEELHQIWRHGWTRLAELLEQSDADDKLPWFGPPMKAQSCAHARQMEVWAHGQDIYDLFGVNRAPNDRIRTICELGVRTHGFAFALHNIDRPQPPEVRLLSPSGLEWVWNEGQSERVSGTAEDFALVVTHRRRASETGLASVGQGAASWLEIAQCFAGQPRDWLA